MNFNKIVSIVFGIYISGLLLMFCVSDKLDFSNLENRYLTEKPNLNISKVLDGEFMMDFESYVNDHFPFRDKFISIKMYIEMLSGKKENNGVYVANDGFLIEKMDVVDGELVNKNIEYINNFSQKYNVSLLLAPTSLSVYEDKLPLFADNGGESESIDYIYSNLGANINKVDVRYSLLNNKDDYIYFKTDHHWTARGAYYAYKEIAESLGFDAFGVGKDDFITVSEDFYGTLFSKGNFTFAKPDKIELVNFDDVGVSVDYVFDEHVEDSLYKMDNLEGKDKYGVFLDNNHPLVRISSDIKSDKKILVIKDSYAHSLIPYLVKEYKEIHVIDLRLFKGSLAEYMSNNGLNDVLMLYNIKGFLKDNNLFRLKY